MKTKIIIIGISILSFAVSCKDKEYMCVECDARNESIIDPGHASGKTCGDNPEGFEDRYRLTYPENKGWKVTCKRYTEPK